MKTKPYTNPSANSPHVDRIDPQQLNSLIKKFRSSREKNPNASMPRELGEIFIVLIAKVRCSNSWRGYSPDWHEAMCGLATIHLCKYCLGYNEEKCSDPVNYFYTMISRAFIQALKKEKAYTDTFGQDYATLENEEALAVAAPEDEDPFI